MRPTAGSGMHSVRAGRGDGSAQQEALTVAVAIVRGDFFANSDVLDHPERDVPAFAKKFDVVVAVVLNAGTWHG